MINEHGIEHLAKRELVGEIKVLGENPSTV
jgi:hypothetical protein